MPVSCSAFTSSVSCTIFSAMWSPQAVTQAAQPLHRSLTKMEKMPPEPGALALRRREDGVDLLISHRHLVNDRVELRLGFGREAVDRLGDFANDRRQRRAGLHLGQHALARELFDLGQLVEHLSALGGIGDVARDRCAENACPDPASSWAAPYPGKPRCTPCTACNFPECRAASRAGQRTLTPCRRWPRRSRPSPRAAWPAGRNRSASGTPHRIH